MMRRARVLGADPVGRLVLQCADSGWGTAPVPPPFCGSSISGLHTQPPAGAQVLVLHEDDISPAPACAVSCADTLGTLPALAPGETMILGPHQEVLSYAPLSGPVVLYKNAAGTVELSVDHEGNLNFIGGALTVNGVTVFVP